MRTKHTDGKITFEPDTHERRYINNASDTFALISAAGTGDLQKKAAEVVKGIHGVLSLLAKQNDAPPETVTEGLAEAVAEIRGAQ